MKIAVLTQPLSNNYGGVFQAYAVQQILRRMGHEVVTLDIPWQYQKFGPLKQLRYFSTTFTGFLLRRLKAKNIFWPFNTQNRNKRIVHELLKSTFKDFISLSPVINTEQELTEYCAEHNFNVYIVGSDQVWRPIYSPNINWFFLSFLADDDNAKRVALAASFGTDKWEYSEEQTKHLTPLAQKFHFVSVREESGVKLCRKYFNITANYVVDPTMLLSPKDYSTLIKTSSEQTYSMTESIFSYMLDDTDEKKNIAEDISFILKKPIKSISCNINIHPYARRKTVSRIMSTPATQWLRGFQESQCVVTDSFHATVFSILYHRPFIIIPNKQRGKARIETLLKTFELEDRMMEEIADDCTKEWLLQGIEWNRVDNTLGKMRYDCLDFLCNALR